MAVNKKTAIVVGVGNRGRSYSQWALEYPKELQIVAVADPRPSARAYAGRLLGVAANRQYTDWRDLVALGKRIADVAIVTTQDQMHREPATAFASLKYHILLEKPMATTLEDCMLIEKTCREHCVALVVCHIMRYYPMVTQIHRSLRSGLIGDVVNIQHRENIGFYHFAHSYVRGNWRNTAESSFSLLAKCCHDIDMLCYWMPSECVKVSSFGNLSHFKKEKQPPGASDRCLECSVEDSCPYSAKRIYLQSGRGKGWPNSVACDPESYPDMEDYEVALEEQIRSGPYGRCVYTCDNDVCDQQVVNMEFQSGATATLTMVAFTPGVCIRETHFFGSKGELHWLDGQGLYHYDFLSKKHKRVECDEFAGLPPGTRMMGHGGADYLLMRSFMEGLRSDSLGTSSTCGADALRSHIVCFAAEEARLQGTVIYLDDFIAKFNTLSATTKL